MLKNKIIINSFGTEIELRKQLKYPPFCDIIMFGISSKDEKEVELAAKKIHSILKKNSNIYKTKIEIYNPVVAPISKIKNKYRWRIIAKCNLTGSIINLINTTLEEFYKLNFKNTRLITDINPNNMN